uniref:Uncharacterized protein n=1 Tax=Glossina austeni TaxID=7395 RepID=A0A1A9UI74_GLOAU
MGSCYVLFYMKICKLMPSSLELRGSNLFQYFFAFSAPDNFLPFKDFESNIGMKSNQKGVHGLGTRKVRVVSPDISIGQHSSEGCKPIHVCRCVTHSNTQPIIYDLQTDMTLLSLITSSPMKLFEQRIYASVIICLPLSLLFVLIVCRCNLSKLYVHRNVYDDKPTLKKSKPAPKLKAPKNGCHFH